MTQLVEKIVDQKIFNLSSETNEIPDKKRFADEFIQLLLIQSSSYLARSSPEQFIQFSLVDVNCLLMVTK